MGLTFWSGLQTRLGIASVHFTSVFCSRIGSDVFLAIVFACVSVCVCVCVGGGGGGGANL